MNGIEYIIMAADKVSVTCSFNLVVVWLSLYVIQNASNIYRFEQYRAIIFNKEIKTKVNASTKEFKHLLSSYSREYLFSISISQRYVNGTVYMQWIS